MTTGILYIIATPLGNLEDLSPRAQETLKKVDKIAAEDTRHSRPLLTHFGINTPCISLHEHNEAQRSQQIIELLKQGLSIALISDAGTPAISDPGFRLVQAIHQERIKVVPIPGPCALTTALSAAGLPSSRFIFEGFLSPKASARQKQLTALKNETRTLVFYEAPHRILETIEDMVSIFGEERIAVIARELTKTFETIRQGTLLELKQFLIADPHQQKGEFVILVEGAIELPKNQEQSLAVLDLLLKELPVSQAVKLAAQITGEKKSWLYPIALEKKNDDSF